jgi:hypothetical protein
VLKRNRFFVESTDRRLLRTLLADHVIADAAVVPPGKDPLQRSTALVEHGARDIVKQVDEADGEGGGEEGGKAEGEGVGVPGVEEAGSCCCCTLAACLGKVVCQLMLAPARMHSAQARQQQACMHWHMAQAIAHVLTTSYSDAKQSLTTQPPAPASPLQAPPRASPPARSMRRTLTARCGPLRCPLTWWRR